VEGRGQLQARLLTAWSVDAGGDRAKVWEGAGGAGGQGVYYKHREQVGAGSAGSAGRERVIWRRLSGQRRLCLRQATAAAAADGRGRAPTDKEGVWLAARATVHSGIIIRTRTRTMHPHSTGPLTAVEAVEGAAAGHDQLQPWPVRGA
jgi:hypothetical protein